MTAIRTQLRAIFEKLNARIDAINEERRSADGLTISKCEVKLLGQMSLLANEKVALVLSLAQTADMDALLKMDSAVKRELEILLKENGLLYDEDSYLIWIPKGAKFEKLFNLKNIEIKIIDPESALVSKAVKAPLKNLHLIRQAIASGKFPGLVDRIEANDGDLEFFAKEKSA